MNLVSPTSHPPSLPIVGCLRGALPFLSCRMQAPGGQKPGHLSLWSLLSLVVGGAPKHSGLESGWVHWASWHGAALSGKGRDGSCPWGPHLWHLPPNTLRPVWGSQAAERQMRCTLQEPSVWCTHAQAVCQEVREGEQALTPGVSPSPAAEGTGFIFLRNNSGQSWVCKMLSAA